MATNIIIEKLKKVFKDRESFSRQELFDFYRQFEPELKETTFRWRIYDLKTKHIIASTSREFFTLSYKPTFKPEIGDAERKIYTKIEKQFPDLKQCIWSTKIATEFMLHIPGRFLIILQVEKEALEPIYEFLKEQNFRNIYIQPAEREIERYIYETESAIILQSLISKAPTQRVNRIATTTIEKMLVDIYCDKKLFAAFHGNELIHMINNAYNRYTIDFTKLFGYAKRRRREKELMAFLSAKTNIPKSILND
ncbi:MAG: hypothetical protein GZ094_21195 [Mariniphaga sp.]|nr:hypothetical protein [Mariniphaga sp.]